jgi:plasmid rolling circle replication initiator protein Rep
VPKFDKNLSSEPSGVLFRIECIVNSFIDKNLTTGKIPFCTYEEPHLNAEIRDFLISCMKLHYLTGSFQFVADILCQRCPKFESQWRKLILNSKFLSDISPRDKYWDKHREATDKVAKLYNDAGYERYSERLLGCSYFLSFEKVVKEQKIKLRAAHFCKIRHCPVCQWRRTLMWTARFLKVMPLIQNDYPKHRYIFLTLTVRNCEACDLKNQIVLMNKAWEKLTARKIYPGVGYIRSVEVTRAYDCYDDGKFVGRHGKTWVYKWEVKNKRRLRLEPTMESHPHFHCLIMVPPGYFGSAGGYLSHDKWVDLWRDCLKIDYQPVVDVRAVKPNSESSLVESLREVLKYTVKEDDLIESADWLVEITNQLHKTRAISLGGVFKNYLSQDDPTDYINDENLDDVEETTGQRYYFNWRADVKRYASKKPINLSE